MSSPVAVEELAALLVLSLVGVGTEVITLGLDHVGWAVGSAVTIKVGQCRSDGWHGNAVQARNGSNLPPALLCTLDLLLELGQASSSSRAKPFGNKVSRRQGGKRRLRIKNEDSAREKSERKYRAERKREREREREREGERE